MSFYKAIPQWDGDAYSNSTEIQAIKNTERTSGIMTKYVGIFKTNEGLANC